MGFEVDHNQNVILGNQVVLGTTNVLGFPYIPYCSGTPTGTPINTYTGSVPMVYDATNNNLNIYNSGWKNVIVNAWNIKGNAGTASGTNFIGTTDAKSFAIRTNNVRRLMVDSSGKVGIGITNPAYTLDVVAGGAANIHSDNDVLADNGVFVGINSSFGGSFVMNNGSNIYQYIVAAPVIAGLANYTATPPTGPPSSNGQILSSLTGGAQSWTNTIPSVASANLAAQSGAVTVLTYATPASVGTYRIGAYVAVTTIATDIISMDVRFTDENNNPASITFYQQGTTSPNMTVTGFFSYPTAEIRVKASTTITVETILVLDGGTIAYDVGATIEQVR